MIMLDLLKAMLIAIAVVIITTTLVARLGLKNVGLLLPNYKIKSSIGWSREKIFELLATPVLCFACHVFDCFQNLLTYQINKNLFVLTKIGQIVRVRWFQAGLVGWQTIIFFKYGLIIIVIANKNNNGNSNNNNDNSYTTTKQ